MRAISAEAQIGRLHRAHTETVQAIKRSVLAARVKESDNIATSALFTAIDERLVGIFQDNGHQASIGTEIKAFSGVLRAWDILYSLIN